MVLHNPNNWHWVSKDVSSSAKAFLERELAGISAEEGNVTAKIDSVLSMDGDCDVSQRKGKVITIFDLKVQLEWSGTGKDVSASGTITIPEVAHDTEEDEYVFEVSLYSEESEKTPIKDHVRSKIVPQIRPLLRKLAPALIAEHGKDIQHAPGFNPASGFSSPKHAPIASAAQTPKSTASTQPISQGSVNVTTVTDSTEFRTSAAELYKTFTDPQRIAAFTRSAPMKFDGANVGGKFELFGGNVTGEYVELEEPTKIVETWRLAQWPAGHYSTLNIRFEQNNVDSVTVMRVDWQGVPIGQEDVTKRNWGEYYVRSIKTTFGFGVIL